MKTKILRDPRKGRGLYATTEFDNGEVIEICELIIMDNDEVQKTLESYVYAYTKDKVAIALGNGSLLNHSDDSNCEFYFNYRKKQLFIKARKRIKPGQEITINYGYDDELKKRFKIR